MVEHRIVELISVFIGLLLLAAVSLVVAKKLRFPYTVGLLILGMGLSFASAEITALQVLQQIHLSREIILNILIPTLIFEAAIHIDAKLLFRQLPVIAKLAVTGGLISTLIVAIIVHLGTPLSFSLAMLFGALIVATDSVTIASLFKELSSPKELSILVEGESLLSEVTAVVLFGIIVLVIQSGTPWGPELFGAGLIRFFVVLVGGLLIGCLIGGLMFVTIRLERESSLIQIALSTVLAYVTFIVAEHILEVSGSFAVLAAGLIGRRHANRVFSKETMSYILNYWRYAAFVANSFIFLLLGFAEQKLMLNIADYPELTIHLLWTIIAVLVARAAIVYGLIPINNKIFKDLHLDSSHQTVIFWGGLRGAIPLALVLSLPPSFEHRALLLNMTLAIVLFTLLVQGTTIRFFLRRLKLTQA